MMMLLDTNRFIQRAWYLKQVMRKSSTCLKVYGTAVLPEMAEYVKNIDDAFAYGALKAAQRTGLHVDLYAIQTNTSLTTEGSPGMRYFVGNDDKLNQEILYLVKKKGTAVLNRPDCARMVISHIQRDL